ncbi:hypothetical protein F4781DRAFT_325216 [Annulohypoxylon bovei var. microspora]|nr:hypothetical protein F4781DRAFT_325216 [Annulohypoxylon bovei var. microspora]
MAPCLDPVYDETTRQHHYELYIASSKEHYRREIPMYKQINVCLGLQENNIAYPLFVAENTIFHQSTLISNRELQDFNVAIPKPYLAFGYMDRSFGYEMTSCPYIRLNQASFHINSIPIWTPYLTVDVLEPPMTYDGLLNSCLGSAAASVHVASSVLQEGNAVFSLMCNYDSVDLHISWFASNGKYLSKWIESFALKNFQSCMALRNCLVNIHEWAATDRYNAIKTGFHALSAFHAANGEV